MCKIDQTISIPTVAVVSGHVLEADTRSSACGLGQLSDVGDFDRKELRGRFVSRRRSITATQHGGRRRPSGASSGVRASAPSILTEHYF